jgi:hypothetical protein
MIRRERKPARSQRNQPEHTAKALPVRWLLVGLLSALCAAAWLLPEEKPELAVAGRLDYAQFVLAMIATAGLASTLIVALAAPPRRRTIAFRIAAVCIGFVVPVLAWEVFAALQPARHPMENPFYVFTYIRTGQGLETADDLPFKRPPHLRWEGVTRGDLAVLNGDADPYGRRVTFTTDSEGFRNGQELRQADLVFLGDSFTEAGNLPEEETFVRLVASATGLSARNMGTSGYTAPTELLVLKKYGLACNPQTVIWQIAESNDLSEAALFQRWIDEGRPNYLQKLTEANRSKENEGWQQHSPSYQLFCLLRSPPIWPLSGTFRDNTGRDYEVRFHSWPSRDQSPVGHPGWPVLADAIEQGAKLLRDREIRLIVMLVPMKIRVMLDAVHMSEPMRQAIRPNWDIPQPTTMASHLETLCQKLNVPFLDLTPVLKAHTANGDLVYLPLDTHLSPVGHKIVGQKLTDLLARGEPHREKGG